MALITPVTFEISDFVFGKWHLLHQSYRFYFWKGHLLDQSYIRDYYIFGKWHLLHQSYSIILFLDSGTYYTIILHNYQRKMPLKTPKISLCLLKLPKFSRLRREKCPQIHPLFVQVALITSGHPPTPRRDPPLRLEHCIWWKVVVCSIQFFLHTNARIRYSNHSRPSTRFF